MKELFLALLFIPTLSYADKSVVVTVNESGITSIKIDSIIKDEQYAKAWFSVEPGIKKTSGRFLYDRAKYASYFDCRN